MRTARLILLSCLLTAAACESTATPAVALQPDARLPAPTFVIDDTLVPDAIYVEQMRSLDRVARTEWALLPDPNVRAVGPLTIAYGTPPRGFVAGAPAHPLFPGLYRVRAVRAGRNAILVLCVATDGSVRRHTGRCAFPMATR